MIKNNKVVTNAGWIIGCKLGKALLTLVVTMVMARYLGPSNYGLINYAAGVVAFVTPLMKLGIDSILVHEIIIHPEKEGETLGTAVFMCSISAVLCIIGTIAFSLIANYNEPETIFVCGLYSLLLLFQAFELIQYWFQAKLLSKYSSIAMLVSYVLVSIIQILLVIHKARIYWFALSYSVDFLIISIILYIIYRNKATQKLIVSLPRAIDMFSISRYYILSALLGTIFNNTDRVMLKLMVGDYSSGIYSAAHTCASMTSFIFIAIIDSMRPSIFEGQKVDQNTYETKLVGLYSIIIYFSLLQSLLITLFAPLIIHIMYGAEYVDSSSVLQIAVWFTTFSYLGTVRNIWMLSEGKQKYLWKITGSSAVLNVILNYLMIPTMGAVGAAIASLVSQIYANLIMGYIIKDIRPNNRLMKRACDPTIIVKTIKSIKIR